ncbi:MAG TPA: hypothetical protein VK470_17330 [Bacteroidota bacterium]|nr:hypothetical protein [Bacteroidota bacterium]
MYEQLLARSERCIEQQPDHQLTVSALWDKVKALAGKERFVIPDTMSDYECLLEGDKRFRFSDVKPGEEQHDEDDVLEKEFPEIDEIEGLGFDHEQKVTLARFMREEEPEEPEDEAFAPRPFKKDEEPLTESVVLTASRQKTAAPRQKKKTLKKPTTKRK